MIKKLKYRLLVTVLLCCFIFVEAVQAQRNVCDDNAGGEVAVNSSCITSTFNTNTNNDYWNSAAGCSAADLDDKWVWFDAISTTTTITYNPTTNDAILTLFEGACSTTMPSVDCANAGGNGVAETIVYADRKSVV